MMQTNQPQAFRRPRRGDDRAIHRVAVGGSDPRQGKACGQRDPDRQKPGVEAIAGSHFLSPFAPFGAGALTFLL
jgi:hypothetical protein